mmetsp:Transcript_114723/g.370917  ORF Transcript_114723/g.370917 Transcript_114723/m.370917 type:complete len:98 (+) Transcript_114723:582-875(+)
MALDLGVDVSTLAAPRSPPRRSPADTEAFGFGRPPKLGGSGKAAGLGWGVAGAGGAAGGMGKAGLLPSISLAPSSKDAVSWRVDLQRTDGRRTRGIF